MVTQQALTGGRREAKARSRSLRNVQALRAVAALMVVLAHVSGFENKAFGADSSWLQGFHDVGATGVDIFFAISGFLMVATTYKKHHGGESARSFLWRRATRIYPPYLIITALIFAVFLWKPGMVNSSQATPPDPLSSFLLLPQEGLPLLLVGWTLVFEMYFYLIFTLGLRAPKRAFQYILGGWVLITGVLSLIPTDNTYLKFLGNPLHFEFIFGALVGYLVTRRIIWKPLLVTMAGVSLSLAWWALMWAGVGPGVASDAFRVPTIGLALAISLYGVIGLETVKAFTFPAWLQKLGDSSYSLYLTHILTITAFGAAFALVPKNPVTHVAGLLGIIAACIIGGLIYYRVAERPLLKAFQRSPLVAR